MIVISSGTSLYDKCLADWGSGDKQELCDYVRSKGAGSCYELSSLQQIDTDSSTRVILVYPDSKTHLDCMYAIEAHLHSTGMIVFSECVRCSHVPADAEFILFLQALLGILRQSAARVDAVVALDQNPSKLLATLMASHISDLPCWYQDVKRSPLVKLPRLPLVLDIKLFEQWHSTLASLLGTAQIN